MEIREGEHRWHRPVMLAEVKEALKLKPDGNYVDATFGRGGHAQAILEQLGANGRLLAIDKDPEAVAQARRRFANEPRFKIMQGSFSEIEVFIKRNNLLGKVDGLLLDLGVSSPQLDDPERGFSFRFDGPLDMRMNPEKGISASQWLAQATENEIATVLKEYGEERYARRIARVILRERAEIGITTTKQLAGLIARSVPTREKGKDPATRSFQALRIFINSELDDLRGCLTKVPDVLAPGGRLAVLSFHSLEDRIVKRFIRDQARGQILPARLPVREGPNSAKLRKVGKPRKPSDEEVAANPRARSAILRIAERC